MTATPTLLSMRATYPVRALRRRLAHRPYAKAKRMSRANFGPFLAISRSMVKVSGPVLVVGAGGLEQEVRRSFGDQRDVISLDSDPGRNPDVVGNVIDLSQSLSRKFACVVALEVLEHVEDPRSAIESIHAQLCPEGVLVLSTPWATPLHDLPNDFFRYTPAGILEMTSSNFRPLYLAANGGDFDALVYRALRGVRSPSVSSRAASLVAAAWPSRAPQLIELPLSVPELAEGAIPISALGYRYIGRRHSS